MVRSFHHIGYPRYHRDILESVTPLSSDTLCPRLIDRLLHAGMYPWVLGAAFADITAAWIWNEQASGAGLSARAGEVVRFYKFIDRDRLMERDAPCHRALLHIIADGDTACKVRFNNVTLGVFTGGYDNKNYTKLPVDLCQVHPSSPFCPEQTRVPQYQIVLIYTHSYTTMLIPYAHMSRLF